MITRLLNFIDNHFELIIYANAFWLSMMILIIVLIRLKYLRFAEVYQFFRQVLFYGILIGETILLAITCVIGFNNMKTKKPFDYTLDVQPTTKWVKQNLKIYFISGPELFSIETDGSGRKVVLDAGEKIREYHFSPDGEKLLVVTNEAIHLLNRETGQDRVIESLGMPKGHPSAKGVISGVRWAPDGKKFCFRSAKWSNVSSQDNWYVYDFVLQKSRMIKAPTLNMDELIWDMDSENLYYTRFQALDLSIFANPYDVKVYKIPMATLVPEALFQIFSDKPYLEAGDLLVRGIHLDAKIDKLSFGRAGLKHYSWKSDKGKRIGIDENDDLYYIPHRWWRKRLYKIPRVPEDTDFPYYQYLGGKLVIQHLRWMPGERYVIMEHYYFGILIMDPSSGQVGILDNVLGNTFGWYENYYRDERDHSS